MMMWVFQVLVSGEIQYTKFVCWCCILFSVVW